MSEQTDYFRAMQQHRQGEHAEQPKVDFYPSSGRWREVGPSKRNHSGGAQRFLDWYADQKT